MASVAVGYARKAIRSSVRFGRSLIRAPLERKAKQLAGEAIGRGRGLLHLTEDDGLARFRADELPGAGAAIPSLLKLAEKWKFEDWRRDLDKQYFQLKRPVFPINLLTPEEVFEHRAFIDLAVHDDILAAVTAYLGQVPRLYNLMLWWSPPNQSAKGSQLYHYDHRDDRQAKVFLNLSDVTKDCGPLHFLTARDSRAVDAKIGYSQGRYTDDEVYSAVPQGNVVDTVAPAGSGFVVDTARCLHYGSRGNLLDRFILLASFARVNSVNPGKGCRVLDPVRSRLARELYDSDPVRALVLNSPI